MCFELLIQNLRGQIYDGTSSMMGKKRGVAEQILKEQPKALITRYHGHLLSLSIKDSNKQCRILNETMGTAGKIVVLIKFFPKRERMLGEINENIEVSSDVDKYVFEKVTTLWKLSVARWTVCGNAFNKVNSLYSYLRAYFCIFPAIYFSIFFDCSFRVWQQFFFVRSICYENATKIQQIHLSVFYKTVYLQFSDIAELEV